ncbi:hypothetical protein [Actinophytocola sp.]|uniref:hypothetical protein n=1 Tax=Actinophytocola sp. TaxID=1872138 RepID=UPI002ED5F1FB
MELQSLRQEIDALGEAEWTSWSHAYGRARDTPGHLAALLGDDLEAQEGAAYHFQSAIVHQYTVWPASPDAFGLLIRVLRVKPLPTKVLEDCLEALAESAEYLGDVPTGTPIPELSPAARVRLDQVEDEDDDDEDDEVEEWVEEEDEEVDDEAVDEEVWNWVLARMAALRPAVTELVDELADRAPAACAEVREAWQPK